MTDFVLRSANKSVMYAAFEAKGIYVDGELHTQGITADDGGWCLVDQGIRTYQTGINKDGEPIYTSDEYWVPLRWNSGETPPSDYPGIDIVWRSDTEFPAEYPDGVTRFA
jgi:hypothetical protein